MSNIAFLISSIAKVYDIPDGDLDPGPDIYHILVITLCKNCSLSDIVSCISRDCRFLAYSSIYCSTAKYCSKSTEIEDLKISWKVSNVFPLFISFFFNSSLHSRMTSISDFFEYYEVSVDLVHDIRDKLHIYLFGCLLNLFEGFHYLFEHISGIWYEFPIFWYPMNEFVQGSAYNIVIIGHI